MSVLRGLITYTTLAVVFIGLSRAIFADPDVAVLIGIACALYVGRRLTTHWDAQDQQTENAKAGELSQLPGCLDVDNAEYIVVYRRGHKGTDHYLTKYLKQSELEGTLLFSREGLRFTCRTTPTERTFALGWSQVNGATCVRISGWLGSRPGLRVRTERYPSITFASSEAVKIVAGITIGVRRHEQRIADLKALEEKQIKSRNLDAISPARFERLVGQLFESMGYRVVHTGGSGDEGVDLSCHRPGNEGSEVIVQCKRYKDNVGVTTIRDFYGVLMHRDARSGYVVTTSGFTEPARRWAQDKPIKLVDRHELARLLETHYPTNDAPAPMADQLTLFDG